MLATNQNSAPPPPSSPRSTAKYTNKDGSKYITVPKTHSDSSQPSTPTMATNPCSPCPHPSNQPDMSAPIANRKKQKRRQKALAKAAAAGAAEGAGDGHATPPEEACNPQPGTAQGGQDPALSDDEVDNTLNGGSSSSITNGHHPGLAGKTKKNKKNKKKKKHHHQQQREEDEQHAGAFRYVDEESPAHLPSAFARGSNHVGSRPSGMSRDKIWSTSNHEERERIKEFWLGLGEDERKSLVKVEKDAVLKKMKEQQKHTCSCTVCGRKRTAIEEELEGLYDAYYLELEQFANQGEGPPMLPPPPPSRDFPPQPPRRLPSRYAPQQPSRGRIVEHVGDEDDDDDLDEVYSEDEGDDDEYSDDEPPEQFHNPYDRDMTDFLTFGNSLQVKGGILTVADDLLKNDGKRFIEMMEQLAERRMAREEDAREQHFSRGYAHPNGSYSHPHNHPPPEEDDYDDEEDEEEDYEDSQEEEYEEEEDQMTEEQRMEEGRRMFQIFAARMFEQRVLSAYKEKVAKERQDKLLEELEEESRQVDQQRAKKAKNAQKKKDKAAQKKQALAEEKARKEAERAADEAARLEAEQKRIAQQKQKAEDKRRQKEAQKRAEEEARLKKEADRQRRIHEQREKQAEQERRAREARERDKKLKEEQRQRDKQAREQREREAQERREKQERDKREKEARAARSLKEAQEAAQRAREERASHRSAGGETNHHHPHSQPVQIPKRGQMTTTTTTTTTTTATATTTTTTTTPHAAPLPPMAAALPQQHPSSHTPASYASPKMPVATPVVPKALTPIRARTLSQQRDPVGPGSAAPSQPASAASQNVSPHQGTPTRASPGPTGQDRRTSSTAVGASMLSPLLGNQQTPVSPRGIPPKMTGHTPPFQMPQPQQQQQQQQQQQPLPPANLQPPPGLAPHRPPGFPSPMTPEPMFSLGFRPGPNMMMPPPGINGPAGGRGFPPGPMPPPGFAHPPPAEPFPMKQQQQQQQQQQPPPFQQMAKDNGGPVASTHARQGSTGFEGPVGLPSLPIGRPAPIGRPGSLSHGQSRDEDKDTEHLGSRVLVDDDEPLPGDVNPGSLRHQPPGPRGGFAASPFMDTGFSGMAAQNPWGPPTTTPQHYAPLPPPPPSAAPPGFASPAWAGTPSMPPGFGLGSPMPALGSIRTAAQPRHVTVRLMLCQACKDLAGSGSSDASGYIDLGAVKLQIEGQSGDASITEQDLLNLCDTEGSSSNGGGTFDIKRTNGPGPGKVLIRWAPDPSDGTGHSHRAVGAPGEMRSPLAGHASLRGF